MTHEADEQTLAEIVRSRLERAFSPSYLEVVDESVQHHGHAAHHAGNKHLAIIITAQDLKNLSRVESHRKIYALLTDLMPEPLHALRIMIN